MDDEVRLVKEVKGWEHSAVVSFWEKSARVIHPKIIFDEGPKTAARNRLVLHDAVTSVKAAKAVMKQLIAKLRKEGWNDKLSPDEQARVDAADEARHSAYDDREAAERAALQAKIDAFPKTKHEKRLADAIANGAKVTSLDLRGKKGDKISFIPPSIQKLTKLRMLILDDNEIETLPPEFEHLKALEYFSIARNKLIDMRPACYLKKLRLLNVHGNQLEQSYAGNFQKHFEIQMGGNKAMARIGWFKSTHTLGIDTDSLYPLDDDRYEQPWKSVKLIHLFGRDLVPADRKNVLKRFPNAEIKWMGSADKKARPKLQTKP